MRSVRLALLLAFLLLASPAWAAITYVNSVGAATLTSVGLLATAATSHTAGNSLVVFVQLNNTQTVSTVTNTGLDTFTFAVRCTGTTAAERIEIWTATNITGGASDIVTAGFTGNSDTTFIAVHQYAGAITSSLVRTTACGNSTTGTALATATFNSTCGDAIVAAGFNASTSGAPYTAGTNYTIRLSNIGTGGFGGSEDRITVADLTSTTATMTSSTSVRWIIGAVVIKPATGCATATGRARGRTL